MAKMSKEAELYHNKESCTIPITCSDRSSNAPTCTQDFCEAGFFATIPVLQPGLSTTEITIIGFSQD